MERDKVFEYIDQHYDEHLRKLQEIVKQPSISAENRGVRQCAELVRKFTTVTLVLSNEFLPIKLYHRYQFAQSGYQVT